MATANVSDLEGRVLILAPSGRDGALAQKILLERGLPSHCCADAATVKDELARGVGTVLATEEGLAPVALAALNEFVAGQESWSDLPILVLITKRADRLDNRALHDRLSRMGNVTVMERPLDPRSLASAVVTAQRARRRQYETRNLVRRIEREVRQRDQFLAMLGHELRNPLGAIRNASELVQRSAPADERITRQIAIMARQTKHLTRIVDDLLDVSRISAGKVSLQRGRIDLRQLVENVVQQLGVVASGQQIELSFSATGQASVIGDPVRLEQVFTNLVTNAIKYTQPGGRIDVSLGLEGGEARVEVCDTGVGIAADMLPFIFDLFCQVEGTLDRSQGGMGIGLTLARSLVELHGGRIGVTSAGAGQGTQFSVSLPLAPAATLTLTPPQAFPIIDAVARYVLVVDDSADNRDSLRDLLEAFGHRVETAVDGPQAVERALSLRPEIAVVDIGLPGFDGYQVARRVRAALGREIYLIALTGYGQLEDRRRTDAAGFDAHLTKPADVNELEELIANRPRQPV